MSKLNPYHPINPCLIRDPYIKGESRIIRIKGLRGLKRLKVQIGQNHGFLRIKRLRGLHGVKV